MQDLVVHRLKLYLSRAYPESSFQSITNDASTRRYFRLKNQNQTLIACVYPLPFEPHHQPFLQTTQFFRQAGLPVPRIIDVSGADGIILQEDFGDQLVANWLPLATDLERDQVIKEAIEIIALIQQTTNQAFKEESIVVKSKFDFNKLFWELEYFYIHFLCYFQKLQLTSKKEASLKAELKTIAEKLAKRSCVVVHRDFHLSNLLLRPNHQFSLGLIDYQDARIGPSSYDLVPLLVERLNQQLTDEKIDEYIEYFLNIRSSSLITLKKEDFVNEFWLTDLQRGLKVLGTFGYMTTVAQRPEYKKFIANTLKEVQRALTK